MVNMEVIVLYVILYEGMEVHSVQVQGVRKYVT